MEVNRKMSRNEQTDDNNTKMDWKVIESYFQNKHLERMVRHQIESYDYFVNNLDGLGSVPLITFRFLIGFSSFTSASTACTFSCRS